ncbi:MAG: hypothetical protein ACUVV4_03475 [Candidatus Bathyarchaeia archaeon]
MRLIEKKLAEINSRIKIYTCLYNQCSNKIEALRRFYSSFDKVETSIEKDSEYQREIGRMRMASRRIEELNKEKDELKKFLNENMHRL